MNIYGENLLDSKSILFLFPGAVFQKEKKKKKKDC
jgi:hypothetical protein